MEGTNHSMVSDFLFVGLTNSWKLQVLLFVFASVFYMASMMGNSLIIFTVASDPHLHSPMYFLLLPFCGPNILDSFYCDLPRFIRLACIDTNQLELMVSANSGFISVGSFFILAISYIVIIVTVQKHSSSGFSKAMSTLSAHISVVVLTFGPLIFIYSWPSPSTHLDKYLAIFDAVGTPFLNPVIYTLRNQEMKTSLKRICRQLLKYGKIS
ncbi:olfactory receptor 4F15-like [Microtus ochrogaster]|uniref:Olfactory receptor 4F15-like n=1 Tax=Microtus ochrogaster TaxID=79684 RepID=A0ABM1AZ98_MICOH|nr:olfactory receptor 4F15-like [Microtus ochrogaster]